MPNERTGDWQPHEQLSGGSSPAEDWREPMVETSDGSNPSEAHVARHLLTGGLKPEDVEPDPQAILAERDLLQQRVAELEAEVAILDSLRDACPPGAYECCYSGVCDACSACPAINRACWLGWCMWYGQSCGDGQDWEYRPGQDRSQTDRFVEPDEALRILNHHGLGDAANALRKEMDGDGY